MNRDLGDVSRQLPVSVPGGVQRQYLPAHFRAGVTVDMPRRPVYRGGQRLLLPGSYVQGREDQLRVTVHQRSRIGELSSRRREFTGRTAALVLPGHNRHGSHAVLVNRPGVLGSGAVC
ncbi:hypothetical protein ABZ372_28860 [Streptomyces sp. NPDC005921]|uniref:hypothetical protein n=1 Tax=Streptomyces sp. NPDC005827 TaxID=3157070 RepID=UPI0033FA6FF4